MADPRIQLQLLDAEIARLTKLLHKLDRRRVPLRRAINRAHVPFLALPVELCAEIFSWVVQQHKTSPLVLTAVCASWRALGLDMPWLWNDLRVNVHPATTYDTLLLVDQWIERAKHATLDLAVKIRSPPHGIVTELFRVLGHSAHRCSSLLLDFDDLHLFHVFPRPLVNLVHAKLVFSAHRPLGNQYYNNPLGILSPLVSPTLTRATIVGLQMSIPAAMITHLTLAQTSISIILQTINNLPTLTHLTINDLTSSDVVNPTIIPAPNIVELNIQSTTRIQISELLDALDTPVLREVNFDVPHLVFPVYSLVQLVRRARGLESVGVGRVDLGIGHRDVRSVFGEIECLRGLDVRVWPWAGV